MTTKVITSKAPDPITGLTKSFLGWQFSGSTVQDAFEGCNIIWTAGWSWQISPVPGTGDLTTTPPTPPVWIATFAKAGMTSLQIKDPDWIAFDGTFVWCVSNSEIGNYTVVDQQTGA